jgi:LacI family transcriptional regulator
LSKYSSIDDNVVIRTTERWEDQMSTLREVAKQAGVSIKTVSRIVNGDAAVNAKTRAAVQHHLTSLNYVPNHAARQMRNGASSVFGLMTDAVATTPYSVDIVRGAQSALRENHQTLLIASSDGDPEREAELWQMFRAHRVAGVVYAAMFHRSHDVGRPAFDKSIVLANCFASNDDRASIIPDDEMGGYTQAKYLLQRGHRHIGIVTLIPELEATRLRGQGMRRAFAEAGVAFDDALELRGVIGSLGSEVLVTHAVAREMLQQRNRPTAIICGTDQLAMQVYSAAASLGLSIPEHLSVIGFDDLKLISETLYPRLTTVALPYFEIGRKAVEIMNNPDTEATLSSQRQLVLCPLVERHSCKPLE